MAKNKKRKEEKKKSNGYQIELIGIFLVILSIIGFGAYGPVGRMVKAFGIFLCGTWYSIFLVALIVVGVYMMIKRQSVKFYTTKLIGIYIIIISILMSSHIPYLEKNDLNGMKVLNETVNNFLASTKVLADAQGGGIIGGLFSLLFLKLVDLKGTKIIIVALLVCGVFLFTGMSIFDIIKKASSKAKSGLKKARDEIKNKPLKSNDKPKDVKDDNKIVVSSMDELIHMSDETIEKEPIEVKHENVETKEPNMRANALLDAIENIGYIYPPISLLSKGKKSNEKENTDLIKINIPILEQVFHDFSIEAKVVAANVGPSVTQYEMEVKAGTKVSKILSINREIALALGAKDVRIQAPIPGKKTIGVEIPNKSISMVQ